MVVKKNTIFIFALKNDLESGKEYKAALLIQKN